MRSVFSEVQGTIWEPILRILIAALFGGVFYFLWLATFLLVGIEGVAVELILWGIAPIITGIGFTVGNAFSNLLIGRKVEEWHKVLVWPLIGCLIGAAVVFWFGPMLIVFAMLLMGTLSLALRELIEFLRMTQSEEPTP